MYKCYSITSPVGLEQTSAPIVTFLDAHCEVNVGWLEPLLNRIYEDRTAVVCPEIDSIDLNNFAYKYGPSGVLRGTFNWDLSFKWSIAPTSERIRRVSPIEPLRYGSSGIQILKSYQISTFVYFPVSQTSI